MMFLLHIHVSTTLSLYLENSSGGGEANDITSTGIAIKMDIKAFFNGTAASILDANEAHFNH